MLRSRSIGALVGPYVNNVLKLMTNNNTMKMETDYEHTITSTTYVY